MKNISHLIERIEQCNLSPDEKRLLIKTIEDSKGNFQEFVFKFLKIVGVSKKVFDLFDIDIGHFLDKFL